MHRRTWLQLGLASAAVLAAGGAAFSLVEPGLRQSRLSASAREIVTAVAGAMLDGSLPQAPQQRRDALASLLTRIDALVAGLPPHVRNELSQLLALLASTPGRRLLAGLSDDWQAAARADVAAALQSMRVSSLGLRRQAYQGLHEIVGTAYFSDVSTWAQMGYPGPTPV